MEITMDVTKDVTMDAEKDLVGGWKTPEPLPISRTISCSGRPRGFRNPYVDEKPGNICYVNSLIQCLLHCESFVDSIELSVSQHIPADDGSRCATCGVDDAIVALTEGINDQFKDLYRNNARMVAIAYYCNVASSKFQFGEQNDCAEFFLALIETLAQEESGGCRQRVNEEDLKTLDNTNFYKLFAYERIEFQTCKTCLNMKKKSSSSMEPLTLGVDAEMRSIEQAFLNRFHLKHDEKAMRECHSETCEGAKRYFEVKEWMLFAPNILLLRPQGGLEEACVDLKFGKKLVLGDDVVHRKPKEVVMEYVLRGALYRPRSESNYSVHYYAVIRLNDGADKDFKWIRKNDDVVTRLEEADTRGLYMLVYERVQPNSTL